MDNCTIKLLIVIVIYVLFMILMVYKEPKEIKFYRNGIRHCEKKNSELTNELLRIRKNNSYYLKIVEASKADPSILCSSWIKGIKKEGKNIIVTDAKECYQSIVEHIVIPFEDGV